MCEQFSRVWYVSQGLCVVMFFGGRPLFLNYQIVHGYPPPPFFLHHSLETRCWCLRYETALSVGTQGDPREGSQDVAEDAIRVIL